MITEKFFNTAGPINPAMHYCLPPLKRFDLAEVLRLIAQHRYFVLHAPRQTGKTSSLLALQDHLNKTGDYRALYVNVEGDQAAREDVEAAININAKSLRLGNFTQAEVVTLYQQHTATTGQAFTAEALDLAWHLTNGQPWLVNALAYESCFEMAAGRDRATTISAAMIEEAKEQLIRQRVTHLDQLTDKLREPRVRRVIEPMLEGTTDATTASEDDVDYAIDLGLVRRTTHGLQIANPIYQEVIPLALTHVAQLNLESLIQPAPWYVQPDGRLDMRKLFASFQHFFRANSGSWLGHFDYQEAAPQLLLQAFLQRIVNGDGKIFREYGLGRRRTDLLILWPLDRAAPPDQPDRAQQRVIIEIKLLYRSLDATIQLGLSQTKAYMDRSGADEGHLLIFDRSSVKSWDEKLFVREQDGIVTWGL
jgi:hypothetical protein